MMHRSWKILFGLCAGLFIASLAVLGTAQNAAAAGMTAQGEETRVWASDLYPAADAPGMMQIVALYPNGNAELVSLYLTKGTIMEYGTWDESDNTLTLTLEGSTDREYDEAVTTAFELDGDQLSDGNFAFHMLHAMTPDALEAMDEAGHHAMHHGDASDSTLPTDDGGLDTVWISDVYPAADASGLITVVALYGNGNMEQTSIYLGKGAVTEIGTWVQDDDMVDVTLTGTAEKEYDEPVEASYVHADDHLFGDGIALMSVHQITPAEMDAAFNPAGTYVSNVYPAASASGLVMVLSLFDNNNAEQTSIYVARGAVSEVGIWAEEIDGSITVTMTGNLSDTYAAPVGVTYLRDGDVLQDGPFMLFRLKEITPDMMDAMTAPAVVATFESDTLPAASSPGRVITLTLYDDGSLEMSTDYMNDEPPIVEVGTWEQGDDDTLTVTLTGQADRAYDEPVVITFAQDGELLEAVEYDTSLYGSEGLTLTEVGEAE